MITALIIVGTILGILVGAALLLMLAIEAAPYVERYADYRFRKKPW